MGNLTDYRRKLDRHLADHKLAKQQVAAERQALAEAKQTAADVLTAQELVQRVAEGIQNQVHAKIAAVVTKCLQAVFGDECYEFSLRFSRKRGKTEAELIFTRDGNEIDDPIDAAGGGVVDVCSFALRIANIMMMRPPLRRFVAFDEPAKHLSKEYRPAFRELLQTLARDLEMQMLVITHDKELAIGKVVELG